MEGYTIIRQDRGNQIGGVWGTFKKDGIALTEIERERKADSQNIYNRRNVSRDKATKYNQLLQPLQKTRKVDQKIIKISRTRILCGDINTH